MIFVHGKSSTLLLDLSSSGKRRPGTATKGSDIPNRECNRTNVLNRLVELIRRTAALTKSHRSAQRKRLDIEWQAGVLKRGHGWFPPDD